MATRVYEEEEFILQDGEVVKIRPLNIKKLREFMKVIKRLDDIEDEDESIMVLLEAAAIAISQCNKAAGSNLEMLEESLDVPTIHKILEIAGGVKMNDPNLLATGALLGRN